MYQILDHLPPVLIYLMLTAISTILTIVIAEYIFTKKDKDEKD